MASNGTSSTDLDSEVLAQILNADERVTGKKRSSKKKSAKAQPMIDTGYKAFTDVFGFDPPSGINHAIKIFSPEDWHESMRPFIPTPDPGYVFQPEEVEAFVVGLMRGEKMFLHGPKGTGKSTMPEQVCALINMPFLCVNGRRDLETGELLGKSSVEVDSATGQSRVVWHDGPVTEVWKYGGLMCYDEISRSPAGVNTSLQKGLEDNGKLYLADKPGSSGDKLIPPHEWTRFVATDNTALQGDISGKYASTLVQDESLLDRFDTVIYMDYLGRKHEVSVLGAKCKQLDMQIAEDMVSLANQVRAAYKEGKIQFTMSIRGLIKWGMKIEYWGCPQRAFYYSFFNKLIEDDQKFVGEIYVKVFGVEPTKFDKE